MNKPVFEFEGILIEQDPLNWIVKVPKEKKGKSKKQSHDNTYFSTLEGALRELGEILTKRGLGGKTCHDIKELREEVASVKREIAKKLNLQLKVAKIGYEVGV